MDMVSKKKDKRKVKFRSKLKLPRFTDVKEKFDEGVNYKCHGNESNEDWCCLKRKLLNVASEVCGYTKGKLKHFETWWWNKDVDVVACRKRESLKTWKQSRNEEDRKKYCEVKKMLGEQYIWLWIIKLQRRWRLIRVVMVVSCLELPNVGLGRRKVLLGLVVLKMKVGWRKCG